MKRLKEGGHSVTDHGDLVSSEYYDECYWVLDRRDLGVDLRRCSSFPREPLSE